MDGEEERKERRSEWASQGQAVLMDDLLRAKEIGYVSIRLWARLLCKARG